MAKKSALVGEAALTLEDLGIDPTPVEEVLPTYIDGSIKPTTA